MDGLLAWLAHLVQHLLCKHRVVSSSPALGTLFPSQFTLTVKHKPVSSQLYIYIHKQMMFLICVSIWVPTVAQI